MKKPDSAKNLMTVSMSAIAVLVLYGVLSPSPSYLHLLVAVLVMVIISAIMWWRTRPTSSQEQNEESEEHVSPPVQEEETEGNGYEEEVQLALRVFENTVDGIVITDSEGVIERVNPAFQAITGYEGAEAIGKKPKVLRSDHNKDAFYHSMWNELISEGCWNGEIWNRRKSGEIYPQWLSVTAMKDETGVTTHYVGIFHDITSIKTNERRLGYQVTHDPLTGLPNRKLLGDHLLKAIAQANRNQTRLAVMFLDLDNFKNVNDSLGHQFGDLLLRDVAQKLIKCCRDGDTVSRFGGDEFVILLPTIQDTEPAAVRVALRILDSFQVPVKIKTWRLDIKTSIGISLYPNDGDSPELLLKNADMAMHEAKQKGKNSYAMFTKEMDTIVQRRIMLEGSIRNALDRGEFRVFYQPKVNIQTGAIVGMEALVRWQREDGEIIPPDEFIHVAEEIGLIVELGEWVLTTACRQTMLWHQQGHGHLGIAVNLSSKQFQNDRLLSQVQRKQDQFGLPENCLTLEITENIVMDDVESAITMMKQFRGLGIRLSIDDFGTGYSSLAYLRRFPINELKIDKSFIIDTPHDEEASNIVKSIVSLADHLNLKIVAEGVETMAHVEFLKTLGISTVQGYFYSKPLPATTFETLLTQTKNRQKTYMKSD